MNSKRMKKQLMAIGVQRNDAAAFIRAYRSIQKSGNRFLCQDIMCGPRPMLIREVNYRTELLVASLSIPAEDIHESDFKRLTGHFKHQIAMRMAEALLDSDAVVWSRRMERKGDRCERLYYTIAGRVRVAYPARDGV